MQDNVQICTFCGIVLRARSHQTVPATFMAQTSPLIKTKNFELSIISKGDSNSKKLALVLPGRLDTKDYWCFSSHLELLTSKGFYAVAVDPPGTWESPGGLELFTTTNYIKAVNELIEYFGNKPTFLFGHSRGGQVAMLVSISNENVTGFAVVNASYDPPSFPDLKDIKDGHIIEHRNLPPGNLKIVERKTFIFPMGYFKDGQQYDLKPKLMLYTKPKLLIIGDKDAYYDVSDVKEIYNELLEPKMLHVINSAHDYRLYPKAVAEVNKVLGVFVDKYLSD